MLDIESLLSPLSDEAPSGADLEYDATFLALEAAGAGKPEQQYGDTIIPAEPPDWATVREHALDLARRTRDLRVGVWLARSGARLAGLAGAVDGLRLLAGLLQRRWDICEGKEMTLLTLQQVADQLAGVSVGLIRKHIRQGKLRAVRLGRCVRVDEQDLLAYVNASKTWGSACSTSSEIPLSGGCNSSMVDGVTVSQRAADLKRRRQLRLDGSGRKSKRKAVLVAVKE